MFKQTKLALAILGLSVSSVVMAGESGMPAEPVCTPGDVTVPCEDNKWDLGFRALYLESLYDGSASYLTNSVANTFQDIDNGWDWGYQFEGSYHFNTGNDITMDWTHYDNNETEKGLIGDSLTGPDNISIDLNNKFDQVNLVMGQHVDMGLIKNARFYGGLQYARIRAEFTNHYSTPLVQQYRAAVFTEMKGWGPVIGVDYSYEFANGFSLTANTATSVLYGNSRYSSQFILNDLNLVVRSVYASKKSVIASLEGKLGVNYAHTMLNGTLNLAAGYQALNYFHALQTRGFSTFQPLADTNFGLHGPYLGVSWVGNA